MFKHFALAASLLTLSTVLAIAQPGLPPAPSAGSEAAGSALSPGAATSSAPRGKAAVRRTAEFQAVQTAKVSLSQALEAAETKGQGKAITADFDAKDGAHYEVKVVGSDGKLMEHTIDATSGQVTKSENQPFERYFTRLKPSDFQNARTTLRQAVTLAEQKAGGKAIEAEVELEGKVIQYDVRIVRPNSDKAQEVTVGGDGQVISVK